MPRTTNELHHEGRHPKDEADEAIPQAPRAAAIIDDRDYRFHITDDDPYVELGGGG